MPIRSKTLFLIAVYLAAGAILIALIAAELSHDRFSDCMGLGAFSRAECEAYARE